MQTYACEVIAMKTSIHHSGLLAALMLLLGMIPAAGQGDDIIWVRSAGTASVNSIRFSKSGSYIAIGDSAGRVSLYTTDNGTTVRSFSAYSAPISTIRFSPRDTQLVATAGTDGSVTEWDVFTGTKAGEFVGTPTASATALDYGTESSYLASGHAQPESKIRVWRTPTHEIAFTKTGDPARTRAIVFGGRETYMAYVGDAPGVTLHTIATSQRTTLTMPTAGNDVAFSSNGIYLAVAGDDGIVYLWNSGGGGGWIVPTLMRLEGHQGAVTGIAFLASGAYLVSSGRDSTVRVWNTSTGVNVYTYRDYPSEQRSVAVQGETVAAGAADGSVILRHIRFGNFQQLDTPVLIAPPLYSIHQSREPLLVWSAVEGATLYEIQLGTDSIMASGFVINGATTPDTSMKVAQLAPTTKFFWRVRGMGDGSLSPWSNVSSFTTGTGGPVAPALIEPANNSGKHPTTLNFRWHAVPAAATYRLQVSSYDTLFETDVARDLVVSDTSVMVSGLDPYANYYWRVRADNEIGAGIWSPIWIFGTTEVVAEVHRTDGGISKAAMLVTPNPIRGRAAIQLTLPPGQAPVRLRLHDMCGLLRATLFESDEAVEMKSLSFDTSTLSVGVYYLSLEYKGGTRRTMIVVQP
jgi:WD40 repeat protein